MEDKLEDELYGLYLEAYGKARSGGVIEEKDYRKKGSGGALVGDKRPLKEQLAISLGVNYAKRETDFLSKADFEEQINHFISGTEEGDMIQ